MKPGNRKILKFTGITLACLIVVYAGISVFGAYKAMVIPRLPLIYQASSLGAAYEDVSFSTRKDNVTLKGWYLPGANDQVIMFIHGGFQNRIDDNVMTSELAKDLVERGYNILLFDLRGRGESAGQGITLSHIDEDIGGAVDYLEGRGYTTKNINIIGFCSGAASASIYASRNEVGSLILDGSFIDNGTMVIRQTESIHLPGWLARLFIPGGTITTRLMYNYHRIDPIDVIPDIKSPLFFIHEDRDKFTTTAETERMFQASTNPANELLELTDAMHSQGFRTHPQEYVDRIDNFLKKIRN